MMTSSVSACMRGCSANGSPRGQLAISRSATLAHQLAVALHALAVERRQQQLALAHVLRVVEQQHGVVAERRGAGHVGLAGVEDRRVAGEDLLDVVRVGEHHRRALLADADREHVAVVARGSVEEGPRPRKPHASDWRRMGWDGPGGSVAGGVTYRRVFEYQPVCQLEGVLTVKFLSLTENRLPVHLRVIMADFLDEKRKRDSRAAWRN